MVWYGTVWYGVLYGMLWYGMVRYSLSEELEKKMVHLSLSQHGVLCAVLCRTRSWQEMFTARN